MDAIDAASAFVGYASGGSGMQDSTMPSETHTITGTATSDSADGLVRVDLMGYTISQDGEQSLELPTTVDVVEGDTVQVTLVGGTGKSPIVTGVVGGGDRLSNNVQDAVQTAQDAADAVAEVADVTNYFWHDEDGAHVTTEPNDATTGPNSLWDSTDLHFRDGTDDVARFGANGSQLGKDDEAHLVMDANSMETFDEDGNSYFFAGDRRDLDTGIAEMTEKFYVVSSNSFLLSTLALAVDYVKVNGVETANYTVAPDSTFTSLSVLTVNDHVALNDEVEISYTTEKRTLAFSLGGSAKGPNSVAENGSFAYGLGSHSEGGQTSAYGWYSHAEGVNTQASRQAAHAEGEETVAIGQAAHVEGYSTMARGYAAHAEGYSTMALDMFSHAEGVGTKAGSAAQHVFGYYNEPEIYGHTVELVGNGSDDNARSNARVLYWNGNEELKGALYLGGCILNGETPYPATRYNTSSSELEYYDGTQWDTVATGGGSATILYDNASGTNADITLSDSSANYDYIEIYFGKLDGTSGGYCFTRLYEPDGKRAVLNQANTPSGYLQIVASKVLVSGNRITWDTRGMTLTFSTSARTWSYGGEENRQLIYRVVGYR